MTNFYTVPAGELIARHAAAHILASVAPEQLAHTVIFVPTRRACASLREALQQELATKATLLPRMIALADIELAFVGLTGDHALETLSAIPPAMPEVQQRYLLAEQIQAFERKRMGGVSLHYALELADALMALQEQCARAQVELTSERLRSLIGADAPVHCQQAMLFLGIISDIWPAIEHEYSCILAAKRDARLLHALRDAWHAHPPTYPVFAIGSTGSQAATAELLLTIANLPNGHVILPGLDPQIAEDSWASIAAGHPLFYIKALLDKAGLSPAQVPSLAPSHHPNIWLEALAPTADMAGWSAQACPDYHNIRLIACANGEEEARVISLLLRESLEDPQARVALITPNAGVMLRVASHMRRYGVQVDRFNAGTLATTQTGSLWMALLASISAPESLLHLRSLLHHPLLNIAPDLLTGLEPGWHGVNRQKTGQLPRHAETLRAHPNYAALAQLVRTIADLSRQEMTASRWLSACEALLAPWIAQPGQGHALVQAQLAELTHADRFGRIDCEDFIDLVRERLATPWRDASINAHPQIFLLTPAEARLQQFDRVILANMQESDWPGIAKPNPWLNQAAQQALGLPAAGESISHQAHDLLMLGSGCELFLTYPRRDQGSPTTRSRFVERLLALLAAHGIAESALTANHYLTWATALHASPTYAPETETRPLPDASQRPHRLRVTDLDTLFTDPFSIYAAYVLQLRPLNAIDSNPEASDFGSLTHKAIEALTQHWNTEQRPATRAELEAIAHHALRDFSARPAIDLFWRERLLNGLSYINKREEIRRPYLHHVVCEQVVEGAISLADGTAFTLHGRMDRVETSATGLTLVDYKTGAPPSTKDMLEGRALQLLAYAMLLAHDGQHTEQAQYWALPRLGEEGEMIVLDLEHALMAQLEAQLSAALSQMLSPATPFLARPFTTSGGERFANDYDGISRYDEWAG